MKNVIFGIVIILMGLVITLSVLSVTGVMNREVEIEDALKESVEKSVDACTTRRGYSLDNNDQFVADLLAELSNAIENDSDIKVEVMGVDKDKGYMSIRVTEYYKTAIGTPKVAMCETTAYVDKSNNVGASAGTSTITFIDSDGAFLGQHTLSDGESIKAPITPSKQGKTFVGWVNAETNQNVGMSLGTANKNNITYKALYS